MNSLHYTHILSHCWLPDNSPGIGSNSGLQKKNLVLIHFIINTCVVVVAAAAQQHVWQEKCCFSKAQLEIFSTFQHKARVITFFFSRTGRTLLLLNAGGQRNEHIYVNTPFLKVKGALCSFGETMFLYD